MSKTIHVDLKSTVVNAVSINLDPDKIRNGNVTLSAKGKSELRVPKDDNDLTFLLVSSTEIESEEDKNILHVTLEINFFFSIPEKIHDYDEIITQQCLPIIQIETRKLASKFLTDMGFPGLFQADKQ